MRQAGSGSKVNAATEGVARRLDPAAFAEPVSPRFAMLMRRRVARQRADTLIADAQAAESKIKVLLRKKALLDAQVRDLEATLDLNLSRGPKAGRSRPTARRAAFAPAETRVASSADEARPANDDYRRRASLKRRARSAQGV